MNQALSDPLAGSALHHYQLLEKLGSGGMGQVWLALDRRLGRRVAIKLLPPDVVADGPRRKRFERESRALAALNHANIVTIHSIEEADGQPFLVMEWIEGKSLEDLIPLDGLPLERCLELAIPMVDAMAQAHRAGIVHRDLKPANVMVRDDGVVKVVDFGISKMEEVTVAEGFLPASTEFKTAEGIAVGTLPYMSPQQLEGRAVDARSDIFSLGVVLYEMATGRRPFEGESSASLITAILRDPPPPFSRLRGTVASARLEAIVLRCLAKDPARRYQSAEELAGALGELRRDPTSPALSALDMTLPDLPSPVLSAPTLTGWSLPANASATASSAARATGASAAGPSVAHTVAPPYGSAGGRSGRLWRWAVLPALGAGLALALVTVARREAPVELSPDAGFRGGPELALPVSTTALPAVAVAVLPLANLSGDPGQEYFSDGTTEAVITNLAKISGLRVTSRTSVMRFKGSRSPLPQIARELGVSYVLEGSLAKMADQVVITAQLVDAATDSVVWSDRFQGGVRDIFTFQDKVAEEVAQAARVQITGDDRSRLQQGQAVRPETYELYLKARFLINQRTPEALREALGRLDEVLKQEPGYALAWAAKAECYAHLVSPGLASMPAREGGAQARKAAARAIELDPNLSDAHVVLGFATTESWEWAAAERSFRRAIELNPSNADAYLKYAFYLTAMGRHAEAIKALETAKRLDPLSPAVNQALAAGHRFAGDHDRAVAAARATLDIHPGFWLGHFLLGTSYSSQGRFAEADAELRRALEKGPGPVILGAIGRNQARWGKAAEARKVLAELEEKKRTGYVAPTVLAKLHFALGETDQGFTWMQKALEERDQGLMFLRVDSDYAAVRSDPRFARLLKEVGLNG
ncbi:MAG TPA: protein kinase [Thermoanaerobaculia bacterium]|nr:protein kinase [Thermoanaerobaculia bacterium]